MQTMAQPGGTYKLQVRVTSYKLRVVRYDLRATTYECSAADLEAATAWARSTATVRKLRALAKQNPRTEGELEATFNAGTVRAAARSFCRSTPAGAEALPIAAIAELDDEALHDLALLMRGMVREAAVPLQALVHVLHTLAKKQGGYRCIAVMPEAAAARSSARRRALRSSGPASGR